MDDRDRHDVWFTEDPAAFLDRVGDLLRADPVTGTVLTSNAERLARTGASDDLPYRWFAVVTDGDEVVGVAMRTAPFAPHPVYLLAMPDAAAAALATAVLARGEEVGGVGGLRPAADVFAATVSAATGRRPEVNVHHRLHELRVLVEPAPVAGDLRAVRPEEAALALAWFGDFFRDADAQAGRSGGHETHAAAFTLVDIERRIADGVLWFWTDADGAPVHLTGANPPAYGVARIGPVFTPAAERGRGWAAAAVAEVSRRLLADGLRPILFTDQANPTSNRLYRALGYEPVVDTVELHLVPAAPVARPAPN